MSGIALSANQFILRPIFGEPGTATPRPECDIEATTTRNPRQAIKYGKDIKFVLATYVHLGLVLSGFTNNKNEYLLQFLPGIATKGYTVNTPAIERPSAIGT